jgi:hypothetical protein
LEGGMPGYSKGQARREKSMQKEGRARRGEGGRGCCRGSSSSVRIGLMDQISIKTPNPKCWFFLIFKN